ncbi:hypothetical protein BJ741DRAFT_604028 [Chytriomyces cf. hyalinus JEL632]|nr:hypothetical protein BJ741DRAFT_604028 [Chytriomyces cf. hyalinus JEL632]
MEFQDTTPPPQQQQHSRPKKKQPNRRDPIRRGQQVREAQKTYRQKKAQQKAAMLGQIQTLEQELSRPEASEYQKLSLQLMRLEERAAVKQEQPLVHHTHAMCSSCSSARSRATQLEQQQRDLTTRISKLESLIHAKQYEQLEASRQAAPVSPLATPVDQGSNNAIPSATDLYGPLDYEDDERGLRSLNSLKHCKDLDVTLSMFLAAANSRDKREITKIYSIMISSRYRTFDACTVLERPKAVEFITNLGRKNVRHLDHWYQCVHENAANVVLSEFENSSFWGVGTTHSSASIARFMQKIRALPSLVHSEAVVDDFERAIRSQGELTSRPEKKALFFKCVELANVILGTCNLEDSFKFNLELELVRTANKTQMDSLLEHIQDPLS